MGSFFVGVQTHTKDVFCTPLKNTSSPSVIAAIALMLKVGKRTTHTTRRQRRQRFYKHNIKYLFRPGLLPAQRISFLMGNLR